MKNLDSKEIFVFGSNESGIHGSGAAKTAEKEHGARFGIGFGPNGHSFAIPTKDWNIESLPLDVIQFYVHRFIAYATIHPKHIFKVTRIGCGLAGFTDEQIAPMFYGSPVNCLFDEKWKPIFDKLFGTEEYKYWGTFD